MNPPSPSFLVHGAAQAPPPLQRLRAGPVTLDYQDGTLRFDFDGEATSTFLRNRIGLCVLHPVPACAGARVRALLTDGSVRELTFPQVIAAEQPVRGFDTLAGLDHEILPGLWAEVRFTGETFETEDQRNWIDASFKTYGTPLRLPFPVEVRAGDRMRQRVEVRFRDDRRTPSGRPTIHAGNSSSSSENSVEPSVVRVSCPTDGWNPLPDLGLGAPSHRDFHDFRALDLLAVLPISHLRVDVSPSDTGSSLGLTLATSDATELGWPLELVLHLDDFDGWESPEAWLKILRGQLERARCDLARILVLGLGSTNSTTAGALALVREHLGDLGVPIGAGTNGDLYQLNLQRPPTDADFVAWSMNPQMHARDTRSLMETARGSMLPDQFPSFPGDVFPVWHVLAGLSGFRCVAAGQVSHPERIAALGLSDKSGRSRMILANLTPESVEVCLNLPGTTVRLLDEQSVAGAMREPESWWKQEPRLVSTLRLTAHAIAFIDLA